MKSPIISILSGFALATSISIVLASDNAAEAAQLALYDFTGKTGSQTQTLVTSVISNLSASAISRGGGLVANAGAKSINSNSWTTASSIDLNSLSFFAIRGKLVVSR